MPQFLFMFSNSLYEMFHFILLGMDYFSFSFTLIKCHFCNSGFVNTIPQYKPGGEDCFYSVSIDTVKLLLLVKESVSVYCLSRELPLYELVGTTGIYAYVI
jgi:hypothetical protein